MVGHLCYVYMFGVENADIEEAVEATAPPASHSPPLRLKLVPLSLAEKMLHSETDITQLQMR